MGKPEDDAAIQWLTDAPAASAHILQMLSAQPVPPDPPTPGGGMDYPQNEQQLRDALRGYANDSVVGQLDPRTHVEVSSTLEIAQATATGYPWGVNGNYAKIVWKGEAGQDLLRFVGTQGQANRGLTIERLVLDGNAPWLNDAGAAACLKLSAPLGDNGPLYKFTLRDVYTMSAHNGIVIEGGVYEGMMLNCHVENCSSDGMFLQHLPNAIVSNIFIVHPNSSRNFGAGIRCTYSTYIIGGSFILNGNGAVQAPEGLRGAIMCNGENTAGADQAMFVVPNNGYGSYIEMCEASSDGKTVCRKFNGGTNQWEDVGAPMLYLISMGAGVTQKDNHVSYYGAPPDPMRVVK